MGMGEEPHFAHETWRMGERAILHGDKRDRFGGERIWDKNHGVMLIFLDPCGILEGNAHECTHPCCRPAFLVFPWAA